MNRNLTMKQYMKDNLPLFIFVSVLFTIGVVFGAVMVNALSLEQKQEMTRHLGSFFHEINEGAEFDSRQSFVQAFGMHMKWILLIWLFGLSIVGLPLILVLDFLKGVLIGFTVGYLVGQMSWKGMLFALVSVAPQNLIVIPAILFCSVAAMAFSIYMIKNRFMSRNGNMYQPFMRYTTLTLLMGVFLFGAALWEGYISQLMMKWVTPMLVGLYG
ncbi:stage II sporulation protein M [Paenibacillus alginolyticus]|uniref:Stage II sporulation protein M n=1 Tax=Paenibacillus alginolyticus TaxID=59839 RepID=A0ABT4GD68_9BACL|nr:MULTISPECIES: stage II sporulation protein M [Paenibacillus]MCY9664789.1 stage II sporulation protein M [Paenibacillus alginolyticus]MCY9694107.1 stage II sporulation protein M [Paenibacillus alginolyticus]MEC0143565.1 stage II sporulation protein M [Paenibacillus alginolyticus]NRF89627.1 stage II sporulation protein M [Paenibacillus frigoriresistens]